MRRLYTHHFPTEMRGTSEEKGDDVGVSQTKHPDQYIGQISTIIFTTLSSLRSRCRVACGDVSCRQFGQRSFSLLSGASRGHKSLGSAFLGTFIVSGTGQKDELVVNKKSPKVSGVTAGVNMNMWPWPFKFTPPEVWRQNE
ncbi:hypothetical protein Baya_6716 [Bagarius yarrelli]|uniref:Uncharacterized protein n=1 Tax=Bagarius yarrelli TaxID=175774 RepID=A0A556U1N0_BAGYA|nr:hypothetical protein Baya_6716 [Bagarius yarrelli]